MCGKVSFINKCLSVVKFPLKYLQGTFYSSCVCVCLFAAAATATATVITLAYHLVFISLVNLGYGCP